VVHAEIKDESLLKIALESDPSIIDKLPNPSEELKQHAIFHKMKKG
jgi:hypothetical protein